MVQFEKIIIGDFFKDRLSAYSIINIKVKFVKKFI